MKIPRLEGLSPNDKSLIEEAYKTPIWDWPDVVTMIEDADSSETKDRLWNIAELLRDYDQNMG